MRKILSILLQIACYLGFALVIGRLATRPAYHYADAGIATIKVSLSHATDRVKPCVKLTPEQIAELAQNMRRTESCERERLPLVVEIDVDGVTMISVEAEPSGLWKDGPSSVYERFDLAPGPHRITARLRDTAMADGWDYTGTADTVLRPGRYFTVTFKAETGGFSFR